MKSVCRDTALLFFTLQTPGPLPAYVTKGLGAGGHEAIAKLVLDGIVEIKSGDSFVSGSEAYPLIFAEQPSPAAAGIVGRLSAEAVQYAQGLDVTDSFQLSSRMYLYNTVPVSPSWKRTFPSADAVAEHLGIQGGGRTRSLLEEHWMSVPAPSDNQGWFVWASKGRGGAPVAGRCYKLYVSPRAEHVREGFQAAVEVLTEVHAATFKIGKDVYGMLRPDKLVAYFGSLDEVHGTAERLRRRLKGLPAQGVPFTADVDGEGLLSWGLDPPRGEHLLAWQGPSWRRWITDRLAVALLSAKVAAPGPLAPWQFALERLRLEGIDTTTWSPARNLWEETSRR
jgi:hypothetical protein